MKSTAKQNIPPKSLTKSKSEPMANFSLWGIVLAIVGWTFISFYPSVNCGFVNWDDHLYVYENLMVQQHSIQWKEIFSTPVAANYHPLTMLSLALNYQFSGLNPGSYHITNLVFHLLNTVLVFVFIYSLTNKKLEVAATVSLLFGIHPMHVESVTWVSERKDVLYTFFYMLALVVYLKYLEKPKFGIYLLVFLFFILSCLSKGVAVTLPLVLLLIDYWKEKKLSLKLFLQKIPFLVLSFVFGILAYKIQGGAIAEIKVFTFFERIIIASYGFMMYIFKMFVPINLSAFYDYPIFGNNASLPIIYYLSPLMVITVFVIAIWSLKKTKSVFWGIVFYLITVVLVLQFITVGKAIIADRYTYLSYIGLFFILAQGYAYLIKQSPQLRTPVRLVLLVFALLLSYQTYQRTSVWKSGITLWTDVIEKDPNQLFAYNLRANEKIKAKDYKGALTDCSYIIEHSLLPDSNAYFQRSNARFILGDYKGAVEDLNESVKLKKDLKQVYLYRAEALDKLGDLKGALDDYNQLIAMESTKEEYFNSRGVVKGKLNDFEGASSDFSVAIQLNPQDANSYCNRGFAYLQLNQKSLACDDLQKAAQLGNRQARELMEQYCR